MDLREEFVLKALAPAANIAELCREYAISRKTGYKWLERFKGTGVAGLHDMSRRPQRVVATSGEVVLRILELRRAHPRWGPKKLRILLLKKHGSAETPSAKTIARILLRAGEPRIRRRRRTAQDWGIDESIVELPVVGDCNDMWTVDFKGWWRTRDGQKAEPLTVRDGFSRKVLLAKLMTSTREQGVREQFERLFTRYGLPTFMRSDNGPPFGCIRARGRLTKLSAWWISLGIRVLYGRPAHPQDNGAHERMHADMSLDLELDAEADLDAQQKACDSWVIKFNEVRPHEALGMRTPSELYRPSKRRYRGPRHFCYPPGCLVRRVAPNGKVKVDGEALAISEALGGYDVGLALQENGDHRVWFYELDLGLVVRKAVRTRSTETFRGTQSV